MTPSASDRVYQLMVLTAWSDGELHPSEQWVAGRLLDTLAELQAVGDRAELARQARELLERLGVRAAVDEVASGLTELADQRLAVICCARVLAADGRLAQEEFSVISQLRRRFQLSFEEVQLVIANETKKK